MSLADSISEEVTADGYQPNTDDFEAALEQLLRAADANDVDIERPWDFRADDDAPDLTVEISRLRKRR